jgi:hypothetical protein
MLAKKLLLVILILYIIVIIHAKFFEYSLPLPEVVGEDVTEEFVNDGIHGRDTRFDTPFHHSDYFLHEAIDNEDVDRDDIDILHDTEN